MRRQGIVWLGATIAILGATACFKDPISSLRGTPSHVRVTYDNGNIGTLTEVHVPLGATGKLRIQLVDGNGNLYPFTAPTLATANPSIATLVTYPDSANPLQPYNGSNPYTAPGNPYWKADISGLAAGTTTATITAGSVTDTLTVIVQ